MRLRGAQEAGSWIGRVASVTAISLEKFERGGREPAHLRYGQRPSPQRRARCNSPCKSSGRRYRIGKPFPTILKLNMTMTYMCSHRVRPMANLQYEHMFSSIRRSQRRRPLVRRLSSALLLIRSFLLLEDDYDVDWEVDWDDGTKFVGPDTNGHASVALRSELGGSEGNRHPHRTALQSRLGHRRPGETAVQETVCLCPVHRPERRPVETGQLGSRMSTGNVRVVIER